jgi:hypothetical protein
MRKAILSSLLLWVCVGGVAWSMAPVLVATPRATRLPVSATNRPFLAAARAPQSVDLAASSYVEEELLVSGHAGAPYVTRVLVRRPTQPAKASGRVIVELLDAANGYDTAPLWGLSAVHFLRRGDVWVGVSIAPAAIDVLRRFDAVRYASLALAASPGVGCGARFEVIAQVGALLRSASRENPLHAHRSQRFIAAGYGAAGAHVVAYAGSAPGRLRLGDGAPIFDGFLGAAMASAPAVDACAPSPVGGETIDAARSPDVPWVLVTTESEFPLAPWLQRADSDTPDQMYRRHDIAGAAHDGAFAAGLPSSADLAIAGLAASPADVCVERRSDFPAGLAFNAIWQQFDDLLVRGQAMTSATRFAVDAAGAIVRDTNGNAAGGWRLPQIEVPVARYAGHSTPRASHSHSQSVCARTGAMLAFDAAQLKLMYRDRAQYLRRFDAAVEQAVTNRLLLKEDADALKNPAARALPAF